MLLFYIIKIFLFSLLYYFNIDFLINILFLSKFISCTNDINEDEIILSSIDDDLKSLIKKKIIENKEKNIVESIRNIIIEEYRLKNIFKNSYYLNPIVYYFIQFLSISDLYLLNMFIYRLLKLLNKEPIEELNIVLFNYTFFTIFSIIGYCIFDFIYLNFGDIIDTYFDYTNKMHEWINEMILNNKNIKTTNQKDLTLEELVELKKKLDDVINNLKKNK